jgi:hypothetical protein
MTGVSESTVILDANHPLTGGLDFRSTSCRWTYSGFVFGIDASIIGKRRVHEEGLEEDFIIILANAVLPFPCNEPAGGDKGNG